MSTVIDKREVSGQEPGAALSYVSVIVICTPRDRQILLGNNTWLVAAWLLMFSHNILSGGANSITFRAQRRTLITFFV
jgi:hypothetical protein